MISELRGAGEGEGEGGSLALLTALALVVGAISGAGVACFMLLLEQADQLRDALVAFAHAQGPEGFWLLIGACAAAAGIAASLVRRISPQAAGSGIPHVEAVLNGQLPQAPFRVIPVKFIGGALAIGAGLALGREGPSVHMAATLGHLVGKIFRRDWPDCRVLLAAGAGAGLATAFNAPIAGAIFVLEELVRRFELRIAIAALGASASAISVSRAILGDGQDFHLGALVMPDLAIRPLFFVLGALAGVMAVIYNRVLLADDGDGRPLRPLAGRRSAPRSSAPRSERWPGFFPISLAEAMRSPSGRFSALERLPCFRWFFSCGSRSARSPIRRERPADCSLPCWCLARNSDCSSDWLANSRFRACMFSRKGSPWWEWRLCSPASCARR